ncbi:hypothetical protein [Riemerella columbina]|uniref:hypothetical protein n=1 Tax=Riemerella columbina TaxID=103810 RepID=UPI00267086FA|nr:hypothetical protein [Riemerella columbina]WKS95823.1 hypothetical protein NYR17_03550 [Riemerella columbina]
MNKNKKFKQKNIYEVSAVNNKLFLSCSRIFSKNDNLISELIYNESGVLIEKTEIDYSKENGELVKTQKGSYYSVTAKTYNKKGALVEEIMVSKDDENNDFYEEKFLQMVYNENDQPVKKIEDINSSVGEPLRIEYPYEYDNVGNCIKYYEEITQDYKIEVRLNYNEQNQIDSKYRIKIYDFGKTEEIDWWYFFYDKNGVLINEDREFESYLYAEEIAYNDKGQKISYYRFDAIDVKKNTIVVYDYEYDNAGNVIAEKTWENGILTEVTQVTFNEDNQVLSKVFYVEGKIKSIEEWEYFEETDRKFHSALEEISYNDADFDGLIKCEFRESFLFYKKNYVNALKSLKKIKGKPDELDYWISETRDLFQHGIYCCNFSYWKKWVEGGRKDYYVKKEAISRTYMEVFMEMYYWIDRALSSKLPPPAEYFTLLNVYLKEQMNLAKIYDNDDDDNDDDDFSIYLSD